MTPLDAVAAVITIIISVAAHMCTAGTVAQNQNNNKPTDTRLGVALDRLGVVSLAGLASARGRGLRARANPPLNSPSASDLMAINVIIVVIN